MKKTERHHLKEDEFIHGMGRFFGFAKKWRKEIIAGAVVFVALAVVFAGFQVVRAAAAAKDSRVLGEILKLRAEAAKDAQNVGKLEAMAGRGKYGRTARILVATYWVEQGELDKAQAALAAIKAPPRDYFYYQAQDLAAQVAILKGRYDEAIALLKKIEDEKPEDYILDAVLFRRAEALEKKGNRAEALELYKKVQTDYAQSYFGYDASLRVRKLESGK
jgi:predicted negative regulator of RcsB-dependent stress response